MSCRLLSQTASTTATGRRGPTARRSATMSTTWLDKKLIVEIWDHSESIDAIIKIYLDGLGAGRLRYVPEYADKNRSVGLRAHED